MSGDLRTAGWLSCVVENLQRAEDALMDTDQRRHIDGMRILRKQRENLSRYIRGKMEAVD